MGVQKGDDNGEMFTIEEIEYEAREKNEKRKEENREKERRYGEVWSVIRKVGRRFNSQTYGILWQPLPYTLLFSNYDFFFLFFFGFSCILFFVFCFLFFFFLCVDIFCWWWVQSNKGIQDLMAQWPSITAIDFYFFHFESPFNEFGWYFL